MLLVLAKRIFQMILKIGLHIRKEELPLHRFQKRTSLMS